MAHAISLLIVNNKKMNNQSRGVYPWLDFENATVIDHMTLDHNASLINELRHIQHNTILPDTPVADNRIITFTIKMIWHLNDVIDVPAIALR